jgi:hypothetical protein
MRSNLYQTHIRRFHAVMNEYNTAAHGFKQDLQGTTAGSTHGSVDARTHRFAMDAA